MPLYAPWLVTVLVLRFALSASAQSTPEQLCGRDILTTGDAWENVQVELSQIEAGAALVGQQFPAEQLRPLIPLNHLLESVPPQLRATLVKAPAVVTGEPLNVIFKLAKDTGGVAQMAGVRAFLVAVDGSDFHHATAQ